MMMMGSEEGSQPPDDVLFDDYPGDVWFSVDDLLGENDEPDSKDGLSHEIHTPKTYEVADGSFPLTSHNAAASCGVGEDNQGRLGTLSGNDDDYSFLGHGSESFPSVEYFENEYSGFIFGGPGSELLENSWDHAVGNDKNDLHSYLPNNFHNVQNNGWVTNDVLTVSSPDASTIFPGILPDMSRSHLDGMTSTSRIGLPSVNDHQSFVSGSTFTPDDLDGMDDDEMELERIPLYRRTSGVFPRCASVLPRHSIKAEGNFQMIKKETPHPNTASLFHDQHHKIMGSEHKSVLPLLPIKAEGNFSLMGNELPHPNACYSAVISCQGGQVNTSYTMDDDSDLCILEDMSTPIFPNSLTMDMKLDPPPKISKDLVNTNSSYSKPNDERVIFQQAIEDLSMPRSEASPPDGSLSVSLLKHQRIALSWMVNKETKCACCSGGILADDQGLGKTISTIALILKERPPSSKCSKNEERQIKTEMLNLEDDDVALQNSHTIGGPQPCNFDVHHMSRDLNLQSKGRPSGGTLIVCPTSVLRQWSDELQNKVANNAGLSVLVYYGSNRAKDPCELAMYDVVITTYSIVSMEVPKQPVVAEKNAPRADSLCNEVSLGRKRKSFKTSKQSKKGTGDELNESTSGPLAKVGWFRVVLDEAQSIKNFHTKTARACWGLRAKRRWCLSGTPIQNSIDDLYSYFRFLRHEPYSVLRTFSEQLKHPINRNPENGYKKLQAVLRTIMLRRTKGSLIDGEPIVNLPPKTVELRRIDFSQEERSFYDRLEVESQAEFAKFAESGTVKENYVNILLMLLRLRQACDHPLLVGGFRSASNLSSAFDMAKTLSQERQIFLLNRLEASLAICGICRDPPEDAAVTTCGHVFCYQCISEHILANEALCPTKKCKTHLNKLSIFTKSALRGALSDQPHSENNAECSGSDISYVPIPHSFSCPEDSSKIRTALDILLSMSRKASPTILPEEKNDAGPCDGASDTDSKCCDAVQGGKAIVFSQWTRMLDLLEDCLKRSSIQYRRLDGTMPITARDRAVKDFNNLPDVTVMIMSLKAASLGLNMVAACNVLLLDLWWNPTTEDQAVDRAHRIGQTRPVSVFRLTVKNTVEDRILALQDRKRKMVASAFGENERGSRQTRLTVEDLKYLFGS